MARAIGCIFLIAGGFLLNVAVGIVPPLVLIFGGVILVAIQ